MRFSVAITALIGAVPYLTQGFAIPDANSAIGVSGNAKEVSLTSLVPFRSRDLFSKRADDEWLLVIYDKGNSDNQCGGVAENFSGKGNVCQKITGVTGKLCADVSVEVNFGLAKCNFSFKAEGDNCAGKERQSVEVAKGKSSDRVKLSDDVKFVSIDCSN